MGGLKDVLRRVWLDMIYDMFRANNKTEYWSKRSYLKVVGFLNSAFEMRAYDEKYNFGFFPPY